MASEKAKQAALSLSIMLDQSGHPKQVPTFCLRQHPSEIRREACIAAANKARQEEAEKTRLFRNHTYGCVRNAPGAAYIPHAKIQEAFDKFRATCKHRAPRRVNVRHNSIRASIGLPILMDDHGIVH